MNLGFIGLGIMGLPMAVNLRQAHFDLWVYARTAGRCDPLVEMGATQCESPSELAQHCDVVITILPDTPDVAEVLFSEDGVATGMRPGSVVIDMSTISPRATVEFAQRLQNGSVEMLDAPVSGGEIGAKEARLSIMVGGKREVFDHCLPIFQAMGKNIVYTGTNGNGQKTKLVNQTVGSLNLLAAVEGLRIASEAGLNPEGTLQAVSAGAAGSWMLSNLGPKVIAEDFAPGFSIRLQQKDLRLAMEMAKELGIDVPGTQLTHDLFTRALEQGLGEQGNQGLANLWK